MDEPLSNLDAKLRVQMRAELISLHQRVGITTIYVTHDQTEAMTLGDRVVVMNKGVVQQVDTPEYLYRHPRNVFVASFIGSPSMNFLEGSLDGAQVRIGDHTVELPDALRAQLVANGRRDVVVGLRPEDFVLDRDGEGSIGATVEISERLGPEVLAHVRADGLRRADLRVRDAAESDEEGAELSGTLVARFDPSFAATAGDRVRLRVNASRLQLFDPQTGESIASA